MAAKSVIRQVLDLHRAQLQGVIELRGVRRLRKDYAAAQAGLLSKLISGTGKTAAKADP